MLVFLIVTFSTVLGFLKLTNEKVSVDSADALTMQIKDSIESTLYANTLTSEAVVPIPKTLPEITETYTTGKLKTFTVKVNMTGPSNHQVVYSSIGWGDAPAAYVSAASFVTNSVTIDPQAGLSFLSSTYRYFIVKKQIYPAGTKLCFKACTSSTFTTCIGCNT
jgi:hypothetical protein